MITVSRLCNDCTLSVDAFKVLQTVEGFELLPYSIGFLVALFCFLSNTSPITIAVVIAAVHIFVNFMRIIGLPISVFLLRLSSIFTILHGYGIYLIILAIVGFIWGGWKSIIGYVAGRVLAGMVNGITNHFNGKRIQKQVGKYLTMSEVNFFNAYLYYARREKKSLDLNVSDEELEESNWQPVFLDLAVKWPQIVNRFTND